MDGVNQSYSAACDAMPAPAPLAMPMQDFASAPIPRVALTPLNRRVWAWRAAAFMPAFVMTVAFIWAQATALSRGGLSWVENVHLYLSGFAFLWIAISVGTAIVGLIAVLRSQKPPGLPRATPDLTVALLIPIHNENPSDVFGNASALLSDLRGKPDARRFSLHVLSDTRDAAIAALEWRAFEILRDCVAAYQLSGWNDALPTDAVAGFVWSWVHGLAQLWGTAAMPVFDMPTQLDQHVRTGIEILRVTTKEQVL